MEEKNENYTFPFVCVCKLKCDEDTQRDPNVRSDENIANARKFEKLIHERKLD